MIQGGEQKPGAAPGLRAHGPSHGAAGLAGLAILGILGLAMVGCGAQGSGYGQLGRDSGSLFANVRPSPSETSRLLRNAHYYKLMGRPEVALKELEQAHRQDPDNLQLLNSLAQGYEEVGQFEAARQLYQEALTRHGPQPVLANNFCFTYYLEGRWQEAESCYRQTLERDPGNVAARNNLGLLCCRLGRRDEARRLWQEAEGDAAADAKLGQALAALGMPGGAAYAQGPASAPPAVAVTSAPTPAAAVSRQLAAVASRVHTPASLPAAPAESVRPLAALPPQAPPVAAPGPAPQVATRPHPAPLTCAELVDTAIEVRNGTRTRNLAHETRTRLSREGFTVARIGNHLDFGATKTMIYYRPGAERVARAVGRAFFPGAALEPSSKLQPDVDVKILLGADLPQRPHLMARLAGEE